MEARRAHIIDVAAAEIRRVFGLRARAPEQAAPVVQMIETLLAGGQVAASGRIGHVLLVCFSLLLLLLSIIIALKLILSMIKIVFFHLSVEVEVEVRRVQPRAEQKFQVVRRARTTSRRQSLCSAARYYSANRLLVEGPPFAVHEHSARAVRREPRVERRPELLAQPPPRVHLPVRASVFRVRPAARQQQLRIVLEVLHLRPNQPVHLPALAPQRLVVPRHQER